MARPSTIERLPDDIRAKLQKLLRDKRVSQLDATARINAILAEEGHDERVSKSAVNRYAVRMEEVGKRLRESRQVAEMWIGQLGAEPAGKVGHMLNEIVRQLVFDASLTLAEGDEPAKAKIIKDLAHSLALLEKASSDNVKREQEIRKQAAAELEEKLTAENAGDTMTPERLKQLIRETYGV